MSNGSAHGVGCRQVHKQTRYDQKLAAMRRTPAHYSERVVAHFEHVFERQVHVHVCVCVCVCVFVGGWVGVGVACARTYTERFVPNARIHRVSLNFKKSGC